MPILSKLNTFNRFIWYPAKGCHAIPITSYLTDRSFIPSFSSKKYDKKPSLISEEKLDHSSLSDGSYVAVHLDHVHSQQTTLGASAVYLKPAGLFPPLVWDKGTAHTGYMQRPAYV